MNLSVNGNSLVPPGFRFHPTEEELLRYYLPKKLANEEIDLHLIKDVDLNKLEPWDIQEKCRITSAPQNNWYFFSHKDNKYPTGTRTNRATTAGFWKATGRDKVIKSSSCNRIGMRKTLVFYRGRASRGLKSDWIMHEYRLDQNIPPAEAGWVVCRVFKKASLVSDRVAIDSNILDQTLVYKDVPPASLSLSEERDWAAMDRMVASQLNGYGLEAAYENQEMRCFPIDHQEVT